MTHPDVINLAWAAGIVDGEGCINISFRKNPGTHQLTMRVVSKDPYMCPKMEDIFGGSLWIDKDHRRIWQVTGAKAAAVARMLLPYSVVKIEQFEIAVEYGNTMQSPGIRAKGLFVRREPLARRLKELHQYSAYEE